MNRVRLSTKSNGFTLLEMMVGLVIFAIGVLGFSGMVVMQTKANRSAKGTDESATIMQSAIEDLNGVTFPNLGNSAGLPTTTGLTNGSVWTDGPLNRNGDPIGTSTGPYIYYRSIVICYEGLSIATGSTPAYCGGSMGGNNRPAELNCTSTLSNREKLVRVLVGWTDRDGRCHFKNSDFVAFQW